MTAVRSHQYVDYAGGCTSATVIYEQCYSLTLGHTGQGSDPVATSNQVGDLRQCRVNIVEGETINLSGAVPDASWAIKGWTGTDNDSSTAATNTVTMPAAAHAASVVYEQCSPVDFGPHWSRKRSGGQPDQVSYLQQRG